MRNVIKTANRFDSIWTTFIMLPALVLMLNAGLAMTQGKATPADLRHAGGVAVEKFTGQYVPYIKGTSTAIVSSVNKISQVAASCMSGNHGPVYLNASMSGRNGCSITNARSQGPAIRVHSTYR